MPYFPFGQMISYISWGFLEIIIRIVQLLAMIPYAAVSFMNQSAADRMPLWRLQGIENIRNTPAARSATADVGKGKFAFDQLELLKSSANLPKHTNTLCFPHKNTGVWMVSRSSTSAEKKPFEMTRSGRKFCVKLLFQSLHHGRRQVEKNHIPHRQILRKETSATKLTRT